MFGNLCLVSLISGCSPQCIPKTLMLGKIKGRWRRGWQKRRGLGGVPDLMDMGLSKVCEIVKDREAWHAALCGVSKNWTWLSHWTTNRAPWMDLSGWKILCFLMSIEKCVNEKVKTLEREYVSVFSGLWIVGEVWNLGQGWDSLSEGWMDKEHAMNYL